ncbi:MAG TPA: acyloxyacyl hydrolase [Candidatus Acidoferrales bacterium]|nr:acyloxyacyl hydrolase [Candidatus Acidoferrales bacterium]
MYPYRANVPAQPSPWRHTLNPRSFAFLILLTLAAAPLAHSQDRVLRNEFGFWGAYSATAQNIQGSVTDFQFGVASFRYGRILHSSPGYVIEYTVDVEPVEVSRQNTWVSCVVESGGIPFGTVCPSGRETIYGGGISPIGWKFNFMRSRRWQPLLASTGGLVASRRPIPKDIPLATQFNFTFDFQAGVERFNSSGTHAWSFVAKVQHISNASRSKVNPGANMIMLSASYSFLK